MTNIAGNIKSQRKKLQISQEELASKLYVTRQTVSNYENGKSNPDLETLQQIAAILETDMDYLLYGEQKSKDKKAIRKNAIIFGLCLLMLFATSIIGHYEREWHTATFRDPALSWLMFRAPSLSWFIYVLGYPILLVIAGSSMTRLIMLLTASTPLSMKYKKIVHKSILYSFVAYSILMFPRAIMPAIMNIQRYIVMAANPHASSYSFDFNFNLGPVLNWIYFRHTILFDRYPALFVIFFIIGCLLALTAAAPEGKKLNAEKNSHSKQ